MNNGLEDAVNLSWKLAAALRGWGTDGLLESYGLERQPVFRDVGEDIIGGWIRDDRAFLEQCDPSTDREQFERRFEEMARGFGKRLRDFEPNYEGSPIVFGPDGGVTSAHGSHTFDARPHHHLPPGRLTDGSTVFESLGRGFTLVALEAADDDVRAFQKAATTTGVPLTVVRDTFADGREAYGVRLVLVRPDQFVPWTSDRAPADAGEVFGRVTGRE